MNRHAKVKCAIKFIKKDSLLVHAKMQELMNNELAVLETTSHPNIVQTIELLHDDNFYFIISEFVRFGELYEFVVQKGTITEREVKHIMKQLFLSINYLHNANIVHRDIKPENILISDVEKMEIKLTDFGFATFHSQKSLNDVLGSPIYMPPEIV